MRYNPEKHKGRSIRLRGYDYTASGAYFITVCTYDRRCTLGEVHNGLMQLNEWGQIVADVWASIPNHFTHASLDAFVVMPNHVHGVVWLGTTENGGDAVPVGAQHAAPLQMPTPLQNAAISNARRDVSGAVGMIVRSFISAVTKRINESRGARGMPVWQRNYYESIIRDQGALETIRHYIRANPENWATDTEYRIS